jgi:hypothetical protein
VYIRKHFVRIFVVLTLSFFGLKILIKYLIPLGIKALVIESAVLFLIGVFFYLIAKKTEYRNKEVFFATLSAVLVYFSIFEVPDAIGIVYLGSLLSLFVISFLALLLIQGGEFHRVFFNFVLSLLFLIRFFTQLYSNYFYFVSILIVGALLAIFFFMKGTNNSYFEKTSFYSAGFSFSVILVVQTIVIMATGK